MDLGLLAPFVESGPGLTGGLGPFASYAAPRGKRSVMANFAEHPLIDQQVRDELVPTILWTRATRMGLEEEWRAIRRCEYLLHDEGRKYFGRSDAYLPIFNRNSQVLTSRLARGLFPSDDYMSVSLRGPGDPALAEPLETYLRWEFEENAGLRNVIKPFLRQFTNYGTAWLKAWYRRLVSKPGKFDMEEILDANFDEEKREGLALSARSVFSVYAHPVTAGNLDELTLIFEDIVVPRGYVVDMIRKDKWKNGEAALHAPLIPNLTVDMADQITNMTAITAPIPGILGGKDIGEMIPLTECWTTLKMPKEALIHGEDPEEAIPVRVVMAGAVPVEVTRNPFRHQKPPYLCGRMNVQPGLFYGYGFGRVSRALQYLSNDFVNQTNDCASYALNPITIVAPGAIAGPLRPLMPGVTWYVTDPQNGVKFANPPIELLPAGLDMLKQMTGMLQDYGGAPPIMQGSSSGGTARTATGGQILQQNTQMPLQDIIEDLEAQVMIPLMKMAAKLGAQFCPPEVMLRVAGRPVQINQDDLMIDATMRWHASSQIANQQQRVQLQSQFMQSLQQWLPILMQSGYKVDPAVPLRKIYSDLGFQGFDEFVQQQPSQPPPQSLTPGGPGGPPDTGQDRVRSALEQLTGGGAGGAQQPAEGEGSEFMDVRQNADQLAGPMGAMA